MLSDFTVIVSSPVVEQIGDLSSPKIAFSLQRAINRTTDKARAESARRLRAQVNFPASYLTPANGRLSVTKYASTDDLSAIITGRHRPTSLARFSRGGTAGGKSGARIEVQPGLARFLSGAFFVNLRSGNTDTRNNLGLAIRLPEGKQPDRAYKPTRLGRGLWLLYGPSVDQVFDDVAVEIGPETADNLATEFFRLTRLN